MSRVFISHSSKDKIILVEPLVRYLKANGHETWYDSESINYGDSVSLAISTGLDLCEIFLIVISKNYNNSNWCKRELGAIIANCMGMQKRILIIQVNDAAIPTILSDILYIKFSTTSSDPNDVFREIKETFQLNLSRTYSRIYDDTQEIAKFIVELIIKAVDQKNWGGNLINEDFSKKKYNSQYLKTSPYNEGVILIKPGGTYYPPCLEELFRRICEKCEIHQLRVFNGELIKARNIFEKQYVTSTKIAAGEIDLDENDLKKIRDIYNKQEFQEEYGVSYSKDLIIPALYLEKLPYNMDPNEISELWEKGRATELFWNEKWNGLNKIGYQKTVFPICFDSFSNPKVHIVLNGFIPGYRALFISPDSIVIAIHISSFFPWREIRDKLVGGKSNPIECADGSIRKDAYKKIIPLNPDDPLASVNGQRNVCHCSATLFDGMRELIIWFEYPPDKTFLGKIFELRDIASKDNISSIAEKFLSNISWTTRDDTVDEILYEVRLRIILDNLKGIDIKKDKVLESYAKEAKVPTNAIHDFNSLLNFIQNGSRLKTSGEDFYINTLANMFEDSKERADFFEVSREIKKLSIQNSNEILPEILAEAQRIAASDLLFMKCKAYRSDLDSPLLFRSLVLAELPEEALSCAKRTRINLVKYLSTMKTAYGKLSPITIHETNEWKKFLEKLKVHRKRKGQTSCIILAGGRSTRMSSTIPKPVLPFGNHLLFNSILNNVKLATTNDCKFYAAIGYRSQLIRRALGNSIEYLEYDKTLGLAFRLATCLEMLRESEDLIILTYTDMPLISRKAIRKLIDNVKDKRTVGFITSHTTHLSGHIYRENGKIKEIIQQRLHPERCHAGMERDVGFYVFYNTAEFRDALGAIKNDNLREEFIFADIAEILARQNWNIVAVEEEPVLARGINTSKDLLYLASKAYENIPISDIRDALQKSYSLKIPEFMDLTTLRAAIESHFGPFYFFPWWERMWEGEIIDK